MLALPDELATFAEACVWLSTVTLASVGATSEEPRDPVALPLPEPELAAAGSPIATDNPPTLMVLVWTTELDIMLSALLILVVIDVGGSCEASDSTMVGGRLAGPFTTMLMPPTTVVLNLELDPSP